MKRVALFVVSLALAGCSILPLYTRANERLVEDARPTRATREIAVKDLPKGVFVGIAISGGSLTAAYYGLFSHDAERWNRERVRTLLGKDFQTRWISRWFLPHNMVRYWLTDFDRSDIMKGVFDDLLFEKKTFGDMPPAGPKILINATSLTTGRQFRFTDQDFRTLRSRLDTYPVSHAVMASGAFPGAFNNVTLQNYATQSRRPHYVHLFDGGPADNLGIKTLLRLLREQIYASNEPARGEEVGKVVNEISTQYRLQAPGHTPQQLQDYLYEAARLLVREDLENRRQACAWFHGHGFTDLPCAP